MIPAYTRSTPPARLRLRITAAAESIVRGGHPWLVCRQHPGIEPRRPIWRTRRHLRPQRQISCRRLVRSRFTDPRSHFARGQAESRLMRPGGKRGWNRRSPGGAICLTRKPPATGSSHGESDGWPGLVLDHYDTTLVLKIYTAAWLPRLDEILALFKEKIAVRTNRSSLEPEHSGGRRKTIPAARRMRPFRRPTGRRGDFF